MSSSLWSSHHSQLASRLPGSPVREPLKEVVREQPRGSPGCRRRTSSDEDGEFPLLEELQPRLAELDMLLE